MMNLTEKQTSFWFKIAKNKMKGEITLTGLNQSSLRMAVYAESTQPAIMQVLWNGVLSAVYLCGILLCAVNLTEAQCNAVLLVSITALLASVSGLLYCLPKFTKLGFAVPLIFSAVCFFIMPKLTAGGLLTAYNGLLDSIGTAYSRIMPKVSTDGGSVFLFWLVFASILIIPTIYSVKNHRAFLSSLFAFIMVVLCGVTDRVPVYGLVLLAVGTVGIALNRFGRMSKLKTSLFVCRIAAIICSAVVLSTITGFLPDSFFDNAGSRLKREADSIRYGGENVLPQGDFSHLRDFSPSDKVQLEVVMSTPDSYYLRGYVGESYTSKGWTNLDKSVLYENSDLFYWLHKNKFYGQAQIAGLENLLEKSNEKNTIHVKNINASAKYIYAPYEVISADSDLISDTMIGDSVLSGTGFFGKRSYSYTASQNLIKQYTTIASELSEREDNKDNSISDYLSNEAHYNEFVYKNYLDMPQDIRELLEQCLGEYSLGKKHWDYGKAKQSILNFLTSNCVYSEKGSNVKNDFITEFLTEDRKGYSVHFATAAALMFRYYGIPARYVEGYIISPDDVETASPNTAVEVRETQAHAWVEFYQDGVGWIPFEATPKYLGIMEQAEDLTGVKTDESQDDSDGDQNIENNEDIGEKQGVDEMLEQDDRSVWKTAAVIASVFIAAGFIALLWVFIRRCKKKKALVKTFDGNDLRLAVINMFAYSIQLLIKNKLIVSWQDIYGTDCGLKNICDKNYKHSFVTAFKIYQKADFSSHEITRSEQNEMKAFLSQTRQLCRKKRSER